MSGALPDYRPTGDVAADKATWRAAVRAARRGLVDGWSEQEREAAARALAAAGLAHLRRYAVARGRTDLVGATVTAYEPMRTEPPVRGLTDALRRAGVRVLVPLTLERPRLDWADLDDPGRAPQGEDALRDVDLAFVPGLAVSRAGVRLGQGGGYYDTVLPRLRELSGGAPVVLVLHDHEVVPQVPAAGHDAVVDAVLRPTTGVQRLPLA
ncbi:hypothetical protein AVL62_05790 [Serinicoccus chungangensis]|uniref:5-formyltetrahydrofolate cyclo-ligase n=1 Tax=Serinicoccus chungangensis TaxID=767452 RepID=A0A0W8I8Q2_9MICO|nr:5-formyltetrahydrofolate cyclo-ligase [Serinicoccus chungangensis]KUG55796.1 hypothetical protein AVL62_05790 [Serinicoccus chungangensis]